MSSLQNLLDQRQLWRARESGDAGAHALASGWSRLDRELYGAGWPVASLSELLCAEPVLAWQLLQPALVQLSQQQRLLIWVGHSSVPYAPAWLRSGMNLPRCLLVRANDDEAPWAAEQALRLATGGAVIVQAKQMSAERLRRLQLAAQAGNSFAFLLRPLSAQRHSTPAALRLSVLPAVDGLQLTVHKRRGGAASAAFVVPMASAKQSLPLFGNLSADASAPAASSPVLAVLDQPFLQQRVLERQFLKQQVFEQQASEQQASVTLPPRMAASFFPTTSLFPATKIPAAAANTDSTHAGGSKTGVPRKNAPISDAVATITAISIRHHR